MDDDTIRALVSRLARQHPSGGEVIERAAIMAAGADSQAVLRWIAAHHGEPEAEPVASSTGGLYGGRIGHGNALAATAPRRYVLPPGALP